MISMTKKYRTRSGKDVEIIDIDTTDGRRLYPVTVKVDGAYTIMVTIEGKYRWGKINNSDIFEVKEK